MFDFMWLSVQRLKYVVAFGLGAAASLFFFGSESNEMITRAAPEVNGGLETPSSSSIRKVRLFCWVSTDPRFHGTRAKAVKETWIRHCDGYFFGSSGDDESLPAVNLNATPGYEHLWDKTRKAFAHIHKRMGTEFDWFLKTDDDAFVVVEHLKSLLMKQDPKEKLWLGCEYKSPMPMTFDERSRHMSGGPGYVLSQAALQAFATQALTNPKKCRRAENSKGAYEDIEMGKCLAAVGVKAVASIDERGRHRFLSAPLTDHLADRMDPRYHWLHPRVVHSLRQGLNCCASTAVSFHYVTPELMRLFYYFVYVFEPPQGAHLASVKGH